MANFICVSSQDVLFAMYCVRKDKQTREAQRLPERRLRGPFEANFSPLEEIFFKFSKNVQKNSNIVKIPYCIWVECVGISMKQIGLKDAASKFQISERNPQDMDLLWVFLLVRSCRRVCGYVSARSS